MAFRSDWRMTMFVTVMLPLVLGLGVWQLQRADYKRSLETAYFDQLGGLPHPLAVGTERPAFSRVRITGQYAEPYYLLDNQLRDGRPGYWLYQPFETQDGATRLINRGWFEAPSLRSELPEPPKAPADPVTLVAMVWPDTGMLPLFGQPGTEQLASNLVRLQRLDWEAMVSRQPALLTPELRLEAGQPGVLAAAPQTIEFGVQRHIGYAIQWFGLGAALLTGFVIYGRRKVVPA